MASFILEINGAAHRVTVNADGTKTYDPPLPESEQSRYEQRFQEMLASRRGPAVMTDDVFLAGLRPIDEQLGPTVFPLFRQKMAQQGIALSGTEHYIPTLANKFADPAALVSHGQGRGHIKKVCQTRDWDCDGAVTHSRHGPESDPRERHPKLSKKIINRKKAEYRASDPDATRKMSDAQLTEMIVAKHGKQ